jgi:hypothetical protein
VNVDEVTTTQYQIMRQNFLIINDILIDCRLFSKLFERFVLVLVILSCVVVKLNCENIEFD